jgi:hypothetical protein
MSAVRPSEPLLLVPIGESSALRRALAPVVGGAHYLWRRCKPLVERPFSAAYWAPPANRAGLIACLAVAILVMVVMILTGNRIESLLNDATTVSLK